METHDLDVSLIGYILWLKKMEGSRVTNYKKAYQVYKLLFYMCFIKLNNIRTITQNKGLT